MSKLQVKIDGKDFGLWNCCDDPNFYEQNIMVYNHLRKELDDLTEYAEKLGVKL